MLAQDATPTPNPTQVLPDFGPLTEGLPWWAKTVVIVAICLVLVVLGLPKVLSYFGKDKPADDKPASAPPPVPAVASAASVAGAAANEVAVVTEAMSGIVARIEDRLDRAIAEHERLRREWDVEMDQLRLEVANRTQHSYQLESRLAETTRQLNAARHEVTRLQIELDHSRRRLQ